MLKNLLYIFISVLLVVACKNTPTPNNSNPADTVRVDTPAKKDTIAPRLWIIKDSSMYSKTFLKDLYNNSDSISLVDNYIVDKHDTVYFPDYFENNKQYLFETVKDSVDYKLQIFNCTYIKVQFLFSATKNKKLTQQYYGEAYISPGFFLASGTDNDDSDAAAYGVSEYNGENGKYSFAVSVGGKDDKLLGRFSAYAKDSIKDKGFIECPTLRCAVKYLPKYKHK